jgi:uncharacterized membrane protein
MAETSTTQIDDEGEERESPVRHAHGVRARRHGRASAPGYLGLPVEEEEAAGVDEPDDEQFDEDSADEEAAGDDEVVGGDEEEENRHSRAPRARSRAGSASSGKTRSTQARKTQSKTNRSQSGGAGRRSKSKSGAKPAASSKSAGGSRRSAGKPSAGRNSKSAAGVRKSLPARKSSSSARSAVEPTAERGKSAFSAVKRTISSGIELGESGLRKKATREGLRLAARLARHGVRAGARGAMRALSHAGAAGAETLLERAQRMPIQQSIDVAVPPAVAWEQWMEFTYFPEGTHRVADVGRDGDTLAGQLDGLTSRDWEADIIDERECESFAWRSTKGSDNAGLVTFHELAERLTRIELNLDVRPTDLTEAAGLALRLADHRVRSELRRFKAHAELLSPDIYDELLGSSNSGGPHDDDDGGSQKNDDGSSEE